MNNKDDIITLGHGSGAGLTRKLISNIFSETFNLPSLEDAVQIEHRLAVTTDAHVIKPLFFPGGDIGKLSITGTVNDLAMKGAIPRYILCSFIIEEGLPLEVLRNIVKSMQTTAVAAGVAIIAGDTKVVEIGQADGLYITTTGIGEIPEQVELNTGNIKPGDKIIVNGTLGDHTIAIINQRESLGLEPAPVSDCAALNELVQMMIRAGKIRFLRDATRGGVATILNEINAETGLGIVIQESDLPVQESTRAVCELLGLDPLYMANEGKLLAVVAPDCEFLLEKMRNHPLGKKSVIIGRVTEQERKVYLKTEIGGLRPLPLLASDPLPRIC